MISRGYIAWSSNCCVFNVRMPFVLVWCLKETRTLIRLWTFNINPERKFRKRDEMFEKEKKKFGQKRFWYLYRYLYCLRIKSSCFWVKSLTFMILLTSIGMFYHCSSIWLQIRWCRDKLKWGGYMLRDHFSFSWQAWLVQNNKEFRFTYCYDAKQKVLGALLNNLFCFVQVLFLIEKHED